MAELWPVETYGSCCLGGCHLELSPETSAYQNITHLFHNIQKSAQTEQKYKNGSKECFVEPFVNGPFSLKGKLWSKPQLCLNTTLTLLNWVGFDAKGGYGHRAQAVCPPTPSICNWYRLRALIKVSSWLFSETLPPPLFQPWLSLGLCRRCWFADFNLHSPCKIAIIFCHNPISTTTWMLAILF